MEKTIITSGKSIDLAIESALQQLGLDRDSVSVLVLQQAKAGFLGFGAQPAKVQVTYEVPDPIVEKVPEKPKSALGSASRSDPSHGIQSEIDGKHIGENGTKGTGSVIGIHRGKSNGYRRRSSDLSLCR